MRTYAEVEEPKLSHRNPTSSSCAAEISKRPFPVNTAQAGSWNGLSSSFNNLSDLRTGIGLRGFMVRRTYYVPLTLQSQVIQGLFGQSEVVHAVRWMTFSQLQSSFGSLHRQRNGLDRLLGHIH